MSLVFTMPGKLGDALHEWPAAYWYCTQNDVKCELWLDEKSLNPLVPLFEAQPCVERVRLIPGIQHYGTGGQPWDFGLTIADHQDHQIHHLGMRKFPDRQITMETIESLPLHIKVPESKRTLAELPRGDDKYAERCVLHGNFTSHASGVPSFWRFLHSIHEELDQMFEEVYFVGPHKDTERASEIYEKEHPDWLLFDDNGDFLKLAELVDCAELVIGCGSSVVALAGQLQVPCIRVHDPIGEHPKVIWSNLGQNQLNETERDLRRLWPSFRDEVFPGRLQKA